MTDETMTETTPTNGAAAKPPKKEAKKEPKKAAARPTPASDPPSSASPVSVAEAETLASAWEWELDPTPVEHNFVLISPHDVIAVPFDSRAQEKPLLPDLAQSVADDGINQPVLLTPVRHKTDGRTGFALVAGRCRVRAALRADNERNKLVPGYVRVLTWAEALKAAFTENEARVQLTTWDRVQWFAGLRDQGYTQTQIKDRMKCSIGLVSQCLQILELDTRIQKLVKAGQIEPTFTRHVANLRDPETKEHLHEDQVALCTAIVQDGDWTEDDVKTFVGQQTEKLATRAQEKAERAKAREKAAKTGAAVEEAAPVAEEAPTKYEKADVKALGKTTARGLLDWADYKFASIKNKEGMDPLKIARAEGILEGIKLATGLKDLPKAVTVGEG